jgi:hypothetical protein
MNIKAVYALAALLLVVAVCIGYNGTKQARFGAGVTTINGSDTISNSRAVINQNFTNVASAVNDILGIFPTSTSLTVAHGGTGQSTFTISQLLYGSGTNGLQSVSTSSQAYSAAFSNSGTVGAAVGGTTNTTSLIAQPSFTWFATSSSAFQGHDLISIQPKTHIAQTISKVTCEARNGGASGAATFIDMQLGTGSASTSVITASSTINTINYASSLSIAAGSHIWADLSTTSNITVNSGGLYVNCTFYDTI